MSSSSCNILLYFGLGLMCVGSVIAFVGEDQTLLERERWEPEQALRSKFLFKRNISWFKGSTYLADA